MIDREILSRHLLAALLIAAAFTVLGWRLESVVRVLKQETSTETDRSLYRDP